MNARGFSFIELVLSMALVLVVTSSMFDFVHSARGVFELDMERADMQQRARVSIDAVFKELVMAGAGGHIPAIAPARRGVLDPDLPGSAFADRISVRYSSPNAAGVVTTTLARRVDAAGVPHLMRYDGLTTELPLVDHLTGLRFEYFDETGRPIAVEHFTDGPWLPNAGAADRFDADLGTIRRVRAFVRVRPARAIVGRPLADLNIVLDVSPRNLNLP